MYIYMTMCIFSSYVLYIIFAGILIGRTIPSHWPTAAANWLEVCVCVLCWCLASMHPTLTNMRVCDCVSICAWCGLALNSLHPLSIYSDGSKAPHWPMPRPGWAPAMAWYAQIYDTHLHRDMTPMHAGMTMHTTRTINIYHGS